MATVGDIVKEFKKIYREYSKYEGKVSCALGGSFCQPISPSEYLLDDLRFFVLPIRRLYTISWKLQP